MTHFKWQAFMLCIFLSVSTLVAQQSPEKSSRFTLALILGNGTLLSEPKVPASPTVTDWTVTGEAPYVSGISDNNSLVNMIGVEFRYFVSKRVAIRVSGNGRYRNTPAQENVQGITPATSGAIDPESSSAGWIPNYSATVMDNSITGNVALGLEFHFKGTPKVSPYWGIMIPATYTRRSLYDPTVTVDMLDPDMSDAIQITDVSTRHVEQIGFGGQLVLGSDYYFSESLYLSFEIKPVSYIYGFNIKYPAQGLETRSADTHAIGIFSQPLLKIGMRF
jgi:hypothetical protein